MVNIFLFLSLLGFLSFIPARAADLAQDDIKELTRRAENFEKYICSFPTKDNRIRAVIAAAEISQKQTKIKEVMDHAKNTRPIMHKRVLKLCDDFLVYKKVHGSTPEREVYKSMTREEFINRLLKMRPMTFVGAGDDYLLRGIERKSGSGRFDAIGTDNEVVPLVLADYLSYDEMQISALIGIAGGTHFINSPYAVEALTPLPAQSL